MAFMFEKLEVYQKAVDFADEVAAMTEGFPRGYGFLVDQLNRAALSIATNLAEGNGRFTKPDRRNFFTIARGSAQECVPLMEIARRRVPPAVRSADLGPQFADPSRREAQ
jgi:four helix bundle protein